MNTGLCKIDSGLAAAPRPGMTVGASCRVIGRLLDRRGVAGESRAAHVADLVAVVEAAGAGHRLAGFPHHEIAGPPDMRIDEFALRGVLGQIAQEHAPRGSSSPRSCPRAPPETAIC